MKQIWDTDEPANHWSLSFEEIQLLKSEPARNHLAFASQLKFYQNSGRFPSSPLPIIGSYVIDLCGTRFEVLDDARPE